MFIKYILKILHNNGYLIFGIALGLCLSLNFNGFTCKLNQEESLDNIFHSVESQAAHRVNQNTTRKPSQQKESKLIRPRYYSTELGIREKLFVGVLSSEEKILTQAVHVNKTTEHLVDKVKYFITASQNLRNKFNLTGIVGFTNTKHTYRPFQIIKYIGDAFPDEYDYYFLMHDHNYLNARTLKETVEKISVSLNVYLGTPVKGGSYCDLDAGILFSNSVIVAMKHNLDWCVKNAVSEDDSENLGRCVYYSTKLNCQGVVQEQTIKSFKIRHFELSENLYTLSKNADFKNSVSVYPIIGSKDFYLLHAYFSREHLKRVKRGIQDLSKDLTESWPPGVKVGSKPATRFDLPNSYYFNMTHMFAPDDFTNIREHTQADLDDIKKIINTIVQKVLQEKPNDFLYSRLINGYRTFQLSRGLDYQFDLAFRDLHTGKEVIKRFEVCKPLGGVEFLTKPYTTENSKIFILLPIQEHEVSEAIKFLNNFVPNVMDKRDKVVLMLVLIYQYNTSSKGDTDVFKTLKELALEVSKKYRSEDTKIAWNSVRLPYSEAPIKIEDNPSLNFAFVDLSLKKLGLDSLMLVLDVYVQVTVDFLNRVRMNTIIDYQVFCPIPFRQYNPKVSKIEHLEVHKNIGQFDREEYGYISFYGRDYVKARKQHQSTLPIVKMDADIANVLEEHHKSKGNLFEMFLLYSDDHIHKMRATEAALIVRYHDEMYNYGKRNNLFLGNKAQLAKIVLEYLDSNNNE